MFCLKVSNTLVNMIYTVGLIYIILLCVCTIPVIPYYKIIIYLSYLYNDDVEIELWVF